MKIDLHIHTKMSDGELTPKEVIDVSGDELEMIQKISPKDVTGTGH